MTYAQAANAAFYTQPDFIINTFENKQAELQNILQNNNGRVRAIFLSDLHLFTHYENRTAVRGMLEALYHLKPETLVINGDFLDLWRRTYGRHRPLTEMEARLMNVINYLADNGTQVIITEGNHEADHLNGKKFDFIDKVKNAKGFEKFDIRMNGIFTDPNGRKMFYDHGDICDPPFQRWLYHVGSFGYTLVTGLDSLYIEYMAAHKHGKFSLAAKAKKAVKNYYIQEFESNVAEQTPHGMDGRIVGHIHHQNNKILFRKDGSPVHYVNSGDMPQSCSMAICTEEGKWMTVPWLEHRHHLGFEKLPATRDVEPEQYAAYRKLTTTQMWHIVKTFPASNQEKLLQQAGDQIGRFLGRTFAEVVEAEGDNQKLDKIAQKAYRKLSKKLLLPIAPRPTIPTHE